MVLSRTGVLSQTRLQHLGLPYLELYLLPGVLTWRERRRSLFFILQEGLDRNTKVWLLLICNLLAGSCLETTYISTLDLKYNIKLEKYLLTCRLQNCRKHSLSRLPTSH